MEIQVYSSFFIMCLIIGIAIMIAMFMLVASMARKRHRDVTIWVLLSLFTSPLLICIILLIIGSKDKDDGFD